MDKKNGHWQYPVDIDINIWFGFIYRIVEINTGREYIGKKQFWSHTNKKIKDRKNRKKITKESDWKTYTSSSKHLNLAIKENGIENYSFFIESLHKTRGSLFYAEVEKQIKENVLREKLHDNKTPKYYNKQIAGVRFIPPAVLTEEEYTNIDNYEITSHHMSIRSNEGENNGMYGKKDVKNGLTFEEYYGEERSKSIKNKLRESMLGHTAWNKGKTGVYSDEVIEKWKNDPRRVHLGENNGMYGKPCFYKMTEEEKNKWKENISKASKGKKLSNETKKKMSESFKGRKYPKVECPHCKKIGSNANMIRYHFQYCKENPNSIPIKLPNKKKCKYCDKMLDPGNYAKSHGEKCKHKPEKK